jgi:predicted outer membrane protein
MAMLVLAAAACGDDDMDAIDQVEEDGEQLGENHADAADAELRGMSDDDIVAASGAILLTIDDGEIMHATAALERAADPAARGFAMHMLEMHMTHAAQTGLLLAGHGLEPLDNPVSATLRTEAAANLDALVRASNVDYEYMRVQLMMHAEAYEIVDTLVDLAPTDDLSQFLVETRQVIASHRDDAEDILRDEL